MPFLASTSALLGIVLVPTGILLWAGVTVGVAGFVMVPIISVSYNFATEVSHPIQPALVLGMLMCGGQVLLFGTNFVFLAILNDKNGHTAHPRYAMLLMAGLCFASFLFSIFVKEDLRRLNAKKLQNANNDESLLLKGRALNTSKHPTEAEVDADAE